MGIKISVFNIRLNNLFFDLLCALQLFLLALLFYTFTAVSDVPPVDDIEPYCATQCDKTKN